MQVTARTLYNRVLLDRELGKAAATVCDRLANLDREGTRFRTTLLTLLQGDYTGRTLPSWPSCRETTQVGHHPPGPPAGRLHR